MKEIFIHKLEGISLDIKIYTNHLYSMSNLSNDECEDLIEIRKDIKNLIFKLKNENRRKSSRS